MAVRGFAWSSLALVCALAGAPAAALSVGQVDTFQIGTLQGWGGGASPTNIATGGPSGAGDRYLQITSSSRALGVENDVQWTGNYLGAGITGLRFAVNNQGPDPVALRLTLFGPSGLTAFTSIDEVVLSPASGWVTAEFSLDATALVLTRGALTATLDQTLAGVSKLLLRHDPDPIGNPGDINRVTATLGLDSITAVPEPSTGLLFAGGLAALAVACPVAPRRSGRAR